MKRFTKHLIVRYIISGGTSATVNLFMFSLFYFIFHIYYITSSVMAFIVAFLVSLTLQKFWTFRDHSTDNLHLQIGKYLMTSVFGLVVNTVILYLAVDKLHIYVFFGQILAGIGTALSTFPISRKYVFNQQILPQI